MLAKANRRIQQRKMFKPIPINFPSPDRQGAKNPLDSSQELPLCQDKQRSQSFGSGSSNSSNSYGLDWSFGNSSILTHKTPANIPHSRYRHSATPARSPHTQYSFTYSQLDKTGKFYKTSDQRVHSTRLKN